MAYKNASFTYRVRRNNRKRPAGVLECSFEGGNVLPVRRLHHFDHAGPIGLAQQGEHALLLGHSLRP